MRPEEGQVMLIYPHRVALGKPVHRESRAAQSRLLKVSWWPAVARSISVEIFRFVDLPFGFRLCHGSYGFVCLV